MRNHDFDESADEKMAKLVYDAVNELTELLWKTNKHGLRVTFTVVPPDDFENFETVQASISRPL